MLPSDGTRKLSRLELAVLLILACGSSVVCGLLAILFDVTRVEEAFRSEAKLVQIHISERIGSTDAALTALSGLYKASEQVTPRELRLMAHELMAAYPHIYFAGQARALSPGEHEWRRGQGREGGIESFEIKELYTDGTLGPASPSSYSFPLRLIEPETPALAEMLGLDLANSPALKMAFYEAANSKTVAASPPVRMGQLGSGYFALRALRNDTAASGADNAPQITSMLVLGLEANRFFSGILPPGSLLSICLHNGNGCQQEQGRLYRHEPRDIAAAMLPFGRFRLEQRISFHNQPLYIVQSAPIGLADINATLIAAFTGIPLVIGLGLILAWRRQHSARLESAASARLLRENEDRFRDFANAASDWFWETDARMRYTYVSQPFLDYLGLSTDAVLGQTPAQISGGIDFDLQAAERFRDALERKSAFRDIITHRKLADGNESWLRSSAVPIFGEHGRLSGWRGVSTDVTEQQRAQLMLQQSEARFRHLLETAPVPLAVLSGGRFAYSNGLARKLLMGDSGELVGHSGKIFLVDEEARKQAQTRLARDEILRNFEARMRRADGTIFWCEISAVGIMFNDQPSYLVGYVDISERRRALEILKETNDRFRQLTRTIPVPFLVSDIRDGRLLFANELASDQFDLATGNPDRTTPGWLARLLGEEAFASDDAGRVFQDAEIMVTGSDGREHWFAVSGQRLEFDGLPAVATAFLDITARRQSEAATRAARDEAERANATKSQFLANMSHELRTPLNAIIGFSELIRTGLHGPIGDPRYEDYMNDILASGRHLLHIINDILDLSRIEAGKASVEIDDISFDDLAEESLRFVRGDAQAERIALSSEDLTNGAMLIADPRQMKQIVINLLSNAIKFTPAGGKVVVRGLLERDGTLCLEVQDTGIGIEEAHLARILEPFGQVENSYTRTRGGTGLGLPLARSLAQLNGGTLALASAPGIGTTVSMRFPPAKVRLPQAA